MAPRLSSKMLKARTHARRRRGAPRQVAGDGVASDVYSTGSSAPATGELQLEISIGRRVRLLRQRLQLTAMELAAQAGLSPGMLSKIENGGTSPSLSTLKALARALNDWTLERWVRPHPVFKGSILIAQQDADQAAEEIDRLGDDPGMVQVVMCSASESPFGRRQYHPIYAACQRHRLPLALHIGGEGAGTSAPSTPVGHPNTYVEWYSALPQAYMAHVTSMVSEGVFEQFPGLQSSKAVDKLVAFLKDGTKPEPKVELLTPITITKDNLDKAERLGEVQ